MHHLLTPITVLDATGLALFAVTGAIHGPASAVTAAACCFLLRLLGVRYDLHLPGGGPGSGYVGRSAHTGAAAPRIV